MATWENSTPEEKVFSRGKQWAAATVVAFGGVGMGLCLAWTATALPSIQATGQIEHREELGPVEKSLIASVYFCGALVSCPGAAFTMTRIGRKTCLLWLATLGVVGWLLMATATTVMHLYFGRVLTGMYAGGCTVVVPVYVKELASKENRGVLGSLFSVMLSIGKLTSNSVGILVSASTLSLVCAVQPALHIGLLFLIPDSPMSPLEKYPKGKELPPKNGNLPSDPVPRPLKALWLPITTVFTLAMLSQFCGINVVTFFTNEMFRGVFQTTGPKATSGLNPDTIMVILAALQVVGALPASFLVESFGRKALLLSSLAVMTLSMGVLSGFYYLYSDSTTSGWENGVVPLVFLVAYSVAHNWGIGSVIWIAMAEITPQEISAVISSLSSGIYWMSAFMVTLLYQIYVEEVPLHFWFFLFSLVTLLGGGFLAAFLPETRGLSLPEIQAHYQTRLNSKSPPKLCSQEGVLQLTLS